jgi:hypothetical protein
LRGWIARKEVAVGNLPFSVIYFVLKSIRIRRRVQGRRDGERE